MIPRSGFIGCLLAMELAIGTVYAEAFRGYASVIDVQAIEETVYTPVKRQMCDEPDRHMHLAKPLAATIGEDIRRQNTAWQTQISCSTVTATQPQTRVTAYRVTYRYRGHTRTTRLPYHPGERLAVNVSLSPLP